MVEGFRQPGSRQGYPPQGGYEDPPKSGGYPPQSAHSQHPPGSAHLEQPGMAGEYYPRPLMSGGEGSHHPGAPMSGGGGQGYQPPPMSGGGGQGYQPPPMSGGGGPQGYGAPPPPMSGGVPQGYHPGPPPPMSGGPPPGSAHPVEYPPAPHAPPAPPAQEAPGNLIELDHAIGYSGFINNSICFHCNQKEYVLISGANVIVGDMLDPHNQHFLKGHDDQITALAVSHQGKIIASGQKGDNSDVIVWDYMLKKQIFKLSEHDSEVAVVNFSHDDQLILSVGNQMDGKLFIWDMGTGCIVATQNVGAVYPAGIECAIFGGFQKDVKLRATGRYQFATAGSKKLGFWALDPHSGELTYEMASTGTFVREYTCLAYSLDNEKYLFAGTSSGELCSFQVKNRILVFAQQVCSKGVTTLVPVSKDRVVCGGGDGSLVMYAVQDNIIQEISKISALGSINGLAASIDGVELLAGTNRGFVYRVRCSDFSRMLLTEAHTMDVLSVTYMPGVSDRFITCSSDGTIRLWDANDYIVLTRCAILAPAWANCAIFTDEIIISGWSDAKVRAFRTDNGEPLWAIDNAHSGGVTALELSHNHKFIVTGGVQGEVRVWEIRSREMVSHLKEHTAKVTCVHIFEDDLFVMTGARDRSILTWDLRNERRITSHIQRMGGINAVSMLKDQNAFLSVGQERKITYWELNQSNPIAILNTSPYVQEDDELMAVSLSDSNRYFATGGIFGILRVWDYDTKNIVAEARAHAGTITSIKFAPDDKQVVTTGTDGLVMIWNLYLN